MALNEFDTLLAQTVIEDCLDRLSILGSIATIHPRHHASHAKGDNFEQYSSTQSEATSGLDATQNSNAIAHTLKSESNKSDFLQKLERDRLFVENCMVMLSNELDESNTFAELTQTIKGEINAKSENRRVIETEIGTRRRIKDLNKELIQLKKNQEMEVQKRQSLIAHLKDQLQECKAKTNLESKFVKKSTENAQAQNLAKCTMSENELKRQLDIAQKDLEEEQTSHQKTVAFLGREQEQRMQDLEGWNDKCDTEVENKQKSLEQLQKDKATDNAQYEELKLKFANYKAVVVEDRVEKERQRRELEKQEAEVKATVHLQSWWRGTMVRKGFGEFRKGKGGKKGKKGGKGGKKGGKKGKK